MPCSADAPSESGFTLVEVLAATAVLGVLVLCLADLWAVCDRMSFDLLLRQKAVFVLDGEMERLSVLYDTTGFGAGTMNQTTGYPALANVAGSTTRLTYASGSTGIAGMLATSSGPSASDSMVWLAGSGAGARAYVWLDSSRRLLARVSWMQCAISASTLGTCLNRTGPAPPAAKNSTPYLCYDFAGTGNGGSCAALLLILDYPWQLSNGVPVAMADQATLTLRTIVGRRR